MSTRFSSTVLRKVVILLKGERRNNNSRRRARTQRTIRTFCCEKRPTDLRPLWYFQPFMTGFDHFSASRKEISSSKCCVLYLQRQQSGQSVIFPWSPASAHALFEGIRRQHLRITRSITLKLDLYRIYGTKTTLKFVFLSKYVTESGKTGGVCLTAHKAGQSLLRFSHLRYDVAKKSSLAVTASLL